jgi:hypothetical protein
MCRKKIDKVPVDWSILKFCVQADLTQVLRWDNNLCVCNVKLGRPTSVSYYRSQNENVSAVLEYKWQYYSCFPFLK